MKSPGQSPVVIFSDKKMFTVDQAYNRRNSRFILTSASDVKPVTRTKPPQGAMMFGTVASDGQMYPHFFSVCVKITQEVYQEFLETVVKPLLDEAYPARSYCWLLLAARLDPCPQGREGKGLVRGELGRLGYDVASTVSIC